MQINFYKYQGTGNDFVILDNRNGEYSSLSKKQVQAICQRRFGVGADGLMMLNAHAEYDFEMKYYNADGGESTMCGNGGRCLVKFAYDRGIIKTVYRFLAVDGPHEASVDLDGSVSLKMVDVSGMQQQSGSFVLNTGSPHFVQFSSNVMAEDVAKRGREIRNSPPFVAEGINVNFVEQTEDSYRIKVRTYERGVEDETYSCGTGVTAAALVCYHNDNGFNRVEIDTLGGRLSVDYDKVGDSFQNIWLTGPAVQVFQGSIQL
ncbi:diaminopimelate epimerase [Paracnuella aquatica]|uniref:diaminopimelate epimerase n=1 Tax=Paracnuella aquatica TaxID=2268757 RepID=UPI000DEEADC6|nr:diaminopimelate epimerase [Paracnuella aquatica]RPD51509.1 diaminopimelate epimerase [Paracnuella aquatica]